MNIIGRKNEIERLKRYEQSKEAELIAVYGRRRVGKTFLIKEYFKDRFFFYFTGVANEDTGTHLERFGKSLREYGFRNAATPPTWMDAFDCLRDFIEKAGTEKRKVIFFDEVPWMDTAKSKFISAIEYFWNSFASGRNDILFIVCGSAASWITNKLFRSRGGLYNRITGRIPLQAFSLSECEAFMAANGIGMSRYDITEYYMIFGGVPYYLRYLDGRFSLAQNIDRLLFYENAPLKDEFEGLLASLFKHPGNYEEVVFALGNKARGLNRDEIVSSVKISDGGTLSKVLEDLELSGFIRKYSAFPGKGKGSLYQLTDPFTLFHISQQRGKRNTDEHYWTNLRETPKLNAWRGYAFEQVCFNHMDRIREALGISGILTSYSSWRSREGSPGAQIDLVIDRGDNLINLCEIKFSKYEYEITRAMEDNLRNKLQVFASETKTKKTVHFTLISTYGMKRGKHSGIIQSEVTMDDLFGVPAPSAAPAPY
jgi:AAA+ ATPase superfamily predicted ATPase